MTAPFGGPITSGFNTGGFSTGQIGGVIQGGTQIYQAYREGQTGLHADDPKRFDTASAQYYAAIGGDTVSLCRLKYWGGRRGCADCGGTQYCGMATQAAKDYVEACYIVATQVLAGNAPMDTPAPPYPTSAEGTGSLLTQIASWAKKVSEVSGEVATALGDTPTTNTQQRLDILSPILIVAALGLVFVVLAKRG